MEFSILVSSFVNVAVWESFNATDLVAIRPSAFEKTFSFIVEEVPCSIIIGLFIPIDNIAFIEQFSISRWQFLISSFGLFHFCYYL